MQTITINFPVSFNPEDVIDIIEQNIILNTKNKCVVSLLQIGEKSNTYEVIADNVQTLYYVGVTVGSLILFNQLSQRNNN